MTDLRPIRGTKDLAGDALRAHHHVIETAMSVSRCYGYAPVETPIFEQTAVFSRSLGDTTDVVTKEMYRFESRGGEDMTLRPENTASIVRAVLSNGWMQSMPLRLSYAGPMFRYERPQKGRLRQFHQIGIELLGETDFWADVEVIACGDRILRELGLSNRYELKLNSLGDPASRSHYRDTLVNYLTPFKDSLSADSQERLIKNPLRILDSKSPADQDIVAGAPSYADYLNDDSRRFFESVREGLESLGISYSLDPSLVRGLDYYCHTAFEFVTDDLGAQGTVMGGGRYDGLFAQLGGPASAGIGWAAGIERLAMLMDMPETPKTAIAIVPMHNDQMPEAIKLAEEMRSHRLEAGLEFRGKPGNRLKKAVRQGARWAVLLGEDEIASGNVTLRDLKSSEQFTVTREDLVDRLKA